MLLAQYGLNIRDINLKPDNQVGIAKSIVYLIKSFNNRAFDLTIALKGKREQKISTLKIEALNRL